MTRLNAALVEVGRFLSWVTRAKLAEDRERLFHSLDRVLNDQISDLLVHMLVAGEDHRFWRHVGFDVIAFFRAIWSTFVRGKKQGGSTIEQQLVRTIIGDYKVCLRRKAKEIVLAMEVSRLMQKREIAHHYLQCAYFGYGMSGITSAANRLGVHLPRATAEQSANLIARLKYPTGRLRDDDQAARITRRAKHILSRLDCPVVDLS